MALVLSDVRLRVFPLGMEQLLRFFVILLFACLYQVNSIESTSNCTGRQIGASCKTGSGEGICIANSCLAILAPQVHVKIVVKYPANNRYAKESQTDTSAMWIRGQGLGLNWHEGRQMTNVTKDTWEIVLNFRASQDSFNCKNHHRTGICNKLRFRIQTGQDKIDMVGSDFVRSLPISKWSLGLNSPPIITVYPWFFMKQGDLKKKNVTSPELGQRRPIQIYLPPSFKENIYKPYQLLFLNDGQYLEIAVASLHLDKKITSKKLNEFIVVGIENSVAERTSLLSPSNGTSLECKNGTFADNCSSCNISCFAMHMKCSEAEFRGQTVKCLKVLPSVGNGEKYLDFIQYSLLNHVHLKYRGLIEQKHVGIMGYSLGGLISCHAAWTRPAVFGSAVCSSPSFWWPVPVGKLFPFGAQFEFINKTLSKFRNKRPLQRIYIDMGSAEGDFLLVDPSKRAANRIAETPYFEFDRNLWLMILDKQIHSGLAFLSRFWQPLYTLYASEGSLNVESSRSGGSACFVPVSFMTILLSSLVSMMQ